MSMDDAEIRALIERLQGSAKAFRENPIYTQDGDGVLLTAQADECEQAASALESLLAERVEDREAAEQARLAYGLLWLMDIDRRDSKLRLASDARKALLLSMSSADQAAGIAAARAASRLQAGEKSSG